MPSILAADVLILRPIILEQFSEKNVYINNYQYK